MLHWCSNCGKIEEEIFYKPGGKYYCHKCGRMHYPVMREYLDPKCDAFLRVKKQKKSLNNVIFTNLKIIKRQQNAKKNTKEIQKNEISIIS